jgi:hypothetical protein
MAPKWLRALKSPRGGQARPALSNDETMRRPLAGHIVQAGFLRPALIWW